jgi:hypothetical protein
MKKFRSFGGGRAGPRGGSRGVVSHEPSRVVTDVQAQLDLRPYAQTRSDECTGTASTENSVTTLRTTLDIGAVSSGSYQLAIRQTGQDWRLFPALVR